MDQQKIKKSIKKAKSIKLQFYQLFIFNITIIVALYVKEMTVIYLLGSFTMISLVVSILCYTVLELLKVPSEGQINLIDDETRDNIQELFDSIRSILRKEANDAKGSDKSGHFLKTLVLLAILFMFVPFWVQVLLFSNFVFMWLFMKDFVLQLLEFITSIWNKLSSLIPKFVEKN